MTHVDEVLAAIAEGRSGDRLIEWVPTDGLFGALDNDPSLAIHASKVQFSTVHGWTYNHSEDRIERDGWYAFYRSQGQLAPPIIQWNRK